MELTQRNDHDAKEHYQSFLKKKNRKLVRQSRINTHQLKPLETPNVFDIEPITIEHPKTYRKLSKTIRQTEKVSQVIGAGKNPKSLLFSDTTKRENVLNEKKCKNNETISCL